MSYVWDKETFIHEDIKVINCNSIECAFDFTGKKYRTYAVYHDGSVEHKVIAFDYLNKIILSSVMDEANAKREGKEIDTNKSVYIFWRKKPEVLENSIRVRYTVHSDRNLIEDSFEIRKLKLDKA